MQFVIRGVKKGDRDFMYSSNLWEVAERNGLWSADKGAYFPSRHPTFLVSAGHIERLGPPSRVEYLILELRGCYE